MVFKTLKIYWRILKPHKKLWVPTVILAATFYTGIAVVMPWLISRFIGDLTDLQGKTFADLSWILWAWVAVRTTILILGRIQIRFFFKAITRTLRDIDLQSFYVTMSQGSDFFADNFTGSIVTKFNRFARSFEVLSSAFIYDFVVLLIQFVFPFIFLMFIAPVIGVVLLIWTILFVSILILLHSKRIPLSRRVAEYDSKVTGSVADTVTNALSIKMFAQFRHEHQSFATLSQERVEARYKNWIFGDHIRMVKIILMIILEVIVFYFSIKFALDGTLDVAQVLLIQFYIQQLSMSLWNFSKIIDKLEEALADATEMTEIYELQPTILDPASPLPFKNVQGAIQLDNITFSYSVDKQRPVFNRLSLTIPVGQKIGFVGPSGGGKTTLTKLLLRFMDVESGSISIDGHNIATIAQDDLRCNIAYVPQEPLLFHRTVYENILYGNPNATKKEVLHAAKQANADEFIGKLAEGYDTMVGERGIKLSGGQKQRVAIARAMLKKSPILVLDEATSALDSKSEKLITDALDTLMKNRTTIVIAHRLSTIKKLDRIVVLTEDGAVEDGTHSQLLKKKGLYSELWQHQHDDFL